MKFLLDEALAKRLIEKVTEYTDYNVNIMNEKGIIIASADINRIGKFHEAAYEIIQNKKSEIIIEKDGDYDGAIQGINMAIEVEGEKIGVVGVSGNPKEIRPIADIARLAIEVMIQYENQQLQSIRRQSKKERFIELITSEEHADPTGLRKLAQDLKYREDIIRIPILCSLENKSYQQSFLNSVKSSPLHQSEDISFAIDENYVLIFKTMEADRHMFAEYKYLIAEYLQPTLQWMKKKDVIGKFYIGTFQSSFLKYHYAYQHCKWLENHSDSKRNTVYFYDSIRDYIWDIIPFDQLEHIFNVYGKNLPDKELSQWQELAQSLVTTNFNTAKAAEKIFMHKNTFTYKYNKLRDLLNINPQNTYEDRWFLTYLLAYLKKD